MHEYICTLFFRLTEKADFFMSMFILMQQQDSRVVVFWFCFFFPISPSYPEKTLLADKNI